VIRHERVPAGAETSACHRANSVEPIVGTISRSELITCCCCRERRAGIGPLAECNVDERIAEIARAELRGERRPYTEQNQYYEQLPPDHRAKISYSALITDITLHNRQSAIAENKYSHQDYPANYLPQPY